MSDPQTETSLRQATLELQSYLSGEIAPMMAAEAFDALATYPPEVTARVLSEWIQAQFHGATNPVPVQDLVFHALRKLYLLSEFELVVRAPLMRFLQGLSRILIQLCPEEERDTLKLRLSRLGETETVLASRAEYVHREMGAEGLTAHTGSAARKAAPGPPELKGAVGREMRRLSLLLEHLSKIRIPEGSKPPAEIDKELLAQIVSTAALQSKSDEDLARHLARIQQEGVAAPMGQVFRALGWSLPGWTIQGGEKGEILPAPAGRPIEAMNRIVALAPDAQERAKRWGEMIYAAIEQFNEGRLAQAVSILEAAKHLIDEKNPDKEIVKQVLSHAQDAVAEAVLRRLVEVPEKHGLVRKVLEFFPAYRPEGLLTSLDGEMRRERRKLLLALLECHGKASRDLVLSRLVACLGGDPPDELGYYKRNIAFLLRRIPRSRDDGRLEEEIGLLAAMIERGAPTISAKEAAGALGQLRQATAERVLIDRLRQLEQETARGIAHEEAWEIMDRICASLATQGTKDAIRAVAQHAFNRSPLLGDTMARVAHLSWQDLSVDYDQLQLLLRGIKDLLPSKVLGLVVKRSNHDLECLIQAVSGTPMEEVRSALQDIVQKFPEHALGAQAAKVLAKLEPRAPTASAEALSGDLELFALPNLLQSLAESQSTGELVLFDRHQERRAAITLAQGRLTRYETGRLRGADALYQLLEKPFPGTFAFRAASGPAAAAPAGNALDVMGGILEGLRRHDEYQQARALAPDGIRLEAGGAAALRPEDETDEALARAVWARASAGVPPEECEAEAATDAYRVRRLYAWWIEQGALRARVSAVSA